MNGIIAGQGRVLAPRMLGPETVPVIELAHLSEARNRAYILADNTLAEQAGWDEELLARSEDYVRQRTFKALRDSLRDAMSVKCSPKIAWVRSMPCSCP